MPVPLPRQFGRRSARLAGGSERSGAAIQAGAPNALVVRAFNSLGWEHLKNPVINGVQADLLYCRPDGEPRAVTERLITDAGLNPVRVGDMRQLALVDAVGQICVALAFGQGKGRVLAFKVLTTGYAGSAAPQTGTFPSTLREGLRHD